MMAPRAEPLLLAVDMPFPPSTNTLFFNRVGKGRVRTAHYHRWLNEAGWVLKAQRLPPAPITGDIAVEIVCPWGCRAGDLDNRLKAMLDLLVAVRVIEDDRFIVDLRIRWAEVAQCRLEIRPAPARDTAAA